MENKAIEEWSEFYEGLNEEYRKETGNKRIDISRIDMIRFIAWLRTKLYEAREGKTSPDTESGLHKHIVINWAFFPEEKPKYGDEIIVEFPPEQMTKKEVLIYGRYTDLMDGCKWALITPCL